MTLNDFKSYLKAIDFSYRDVAEHFNISEESLKKIMTGRMKPDALLIKIIEIHYQCILEQRKDGIPCTKMKSLRL